jgi:L-lactate permease
METLKYWHGNEKQEFIKKYFYSTCNFEVLSLYLVLGTDQSEWLLFRECEILQSLQPTAWTVNKILHNHSVLWSLIYNSHCQIIIIIIVIITTTIKVKLSPEQTMEAYRVMRCWESRAVWTINLNFIFKFHRSNLARRP